MVTGHSKSIYTAYCLVDTYFYEDGEERDRESIRHYMTEAEELDGMSPDALSLDPLTLGKSTVNVQLQDAREYFLFILNARVECLKEEWINVITFLQDKIDRYTWTNGQS
ncbi:hypothetical protein GQ53DRAFT_774668 [Thozetella sp. PMI_491]|nr:hypothetical protein GQ53DRAFT_774668 [Thozetella sp. PMI_491]